MQFDRFEKQGALLSTQSLLLLEQQGQLRRRDRVLGVHLERLAKVRLGHIPVADLLVQLAESAEILNVLRVDCDAAFE